VRWNDELRVSRRENKVALLGFAQWMVLPESNYDILNQLIEAGADRASIGSYFQEKEDAAYIEGIINKLVEAKYILEDPADEDKKEAEYDIVTLMLTERCNLACRHCCQNAVKGECKDPSLQEIYHRIDKLQNVKFKTLMITGGEPLIREDFEEIIKYCKKKLNCRLILMTNAILINEKNVDFIVQNFQRISISIDGTNKELTKMVRNADVFELVLQKIKLLQSRQFSKISLSAILPPSFAVYDEFFALCKKLGVEPIVRDYSRAGRGGRGYAQIEEAFESYCRKNNYQMFDELETEAIQNFSTCAAGKRQFTIGPYGDVYPCNILMEEECYIGDFDLDDSIYDKIRDNKVFSMNDQFKNTPCHDCDYNRLCWSCLSRCRDYAKLQDEFQIRCDYRKKLFQELVWGEKV